jgi:hypothetical protein
MHNKLIAIMKDFAMPRKNQLNHPMPDGKLIFVYNADSGLFNTMADIGHKIFSPKTYSCGLCMLTHGYFKERAAWRHFVGQLPIEATFMHRDQFRQAYPRIKIPLPAVFLQQSDEVKLCITAASLRECKNLEDLQNTIQLACGTI